NGATVAFNHSNALSYSGNISSSPTTGNLIKAGTGTLTLLGTNTYGGTTTISGGTLQLGDGGSSGSITGSVVNNAELAFNRTDIITFSGAISGTGAVTQSGTGTVTLSGTNSYTGGTNLNAGALALGSATALGTSGTIQFNGGALQFSAGNTTDYSSR